MKGTISGIILSGIAALTLTTNIAAAEVTSMTQSFVIKTDKKNNGDFSATTTFNEKTDVSGCVLSLYARVSNLRANGVSDAVLIAQGTVKKGEKRVRLEAENLPPVVHNGVGPSNTTQLNLQSKLTCTRPTRYTVTSNVFARALDCGRTNKKKVLPGQFVTQLKNKLD